MRLAPRAPGLQDSRTEGIRPPTVGNGRGQTRCLLAPGRSAGPRRQRSVLTLSPKTQVDLLCEMPLLTWHQAPLGSRACLSGRRRAAPGDRGSPPSRRGFFALERGALASPASPWKVTELTPELLWF